MSVQKRKLGYWSIDFLSGDTHSFDYNLFCDFLGYISSLTTDKRLFKDEKNNKAVAIAQISDETKEGIRLFKLIFKSCKYNHSPDYMSSEDGSERPTDKQLYEGDKELTHMYMRVSGGDAYTVFEERRNGVTMGGVIKYFNRLFKEFLIQRGIEPDFYLWASVIPQEDFLTALNTADRVTIAELFVEKDVLGSGFLNVMDIDDNSQEDLVMTIKAKPRQTIGKRAIKQTFLSLATEGTVVKRIRLFGKDINKMSVMIDSLNGKKLDEVTVNLTDKGIVDSVSIFSKIEEVLGITE